MQEYRIRGSYVDYSKDTPEAEIYEIPVYADSAEAAAHVAELLLGSNAVVNKGRASRRAES